MARAAFFSAACRIAARFLCLPSGVYAFAPTRFEEIDEAALAPLLAEPQGAVELAIFGCGRELRPIPENLRQRLRACGVAVDTMSTGAACQTYNILLGEKRRVAAALIATP